MGDPPLSRRGLLSLAWARQPPARSQAGPYAAALRERWAQGGARLAAACAPLVPVLCDVAGAEPEMPLLDVAAADGALAAEAARRGAIVTACDGAAALVEAGAARTEAEDLDVLWEVADAESLPFADRAFEAVVSLHGAALAPRAKRTARELLRVLGRGGLLVLAAPAPGSFLARAHALAGPLPPGVPAPALWGDEDVARERIEAVAPGTDVELRTVPYGLAFATEADAWAACSAVLGIPATERDAFADLVTAAGPASGGPIDERATLVLARRG